MIRPVDADTTSKPASRASCPPRPDPTSPEGKAPMPPNKRRIKPADVEHRGRVTIPRDPAATNLGAEPQGEEPTLSERAKRYERGPVTPPASSRYTPPIKSVRLRPGWHKKVGALILVAGVVIAVLNDVMLLAPSTTVLPGGHSEFYLMLGIAIAGYSTRWFGWFDRAK